MTHIACQAIRQLLSISENKELLIDYIYFEYNTFLLEVYNHSCNVSYY